MLTLVSAAVVLGGCGKPAARPPEKALVRTAVVQPMDGLRSDGQASYLALVKFDHETDLSFKVGGILVSVGATAGTDWDEGTPVKAGMVLAELKQADFTNALNSARATRGPGEQDSRTFPQAARHRCDFPTGTRCH